MPGEGEKTALERDAPVVVAGAGLVGCMSAILLGRRGYDIKVYEGRESWTEDVNASKGLMGQLSNAKKRSINLALSHRGLSALIKVGLADEVLENSVAMHGRMIHPPGETDHAKTDFQPYDHKAGNHIYSISREELNQALLDEIATMDNVSVEYDRKFESMDQDKMTCTLASGKGVRHTVPAKFCLGADGAFSKVRDLALARMERLNFNREFIAHGYKELSMPPTPSGDFAMSPHALHIWPRGAFMMIALPNADKTFTCTLFMPFADLDKLTTPQEVSAFFDIHFPDVTAKYGNLMPDFPEEFFSNPSSPLVNLSCSPWHHSDKLLILGDAAHATVPFYGQGMNAAFEDALRLDEMLSECGDDIAKTFAKYSAEMIPSRLGLSEVSMQNYEEMASKTNSRLFALKRRIDGLLETMAPQSWIPLYTMVTFTRIPYDEAIRRAKSQDRILSVLGLATLGAAALLTLPRLAALANARLA